MTHKDDKQQDTAMNIFIARQPIFDRKKNVYAYELLYRSDLENRAFVSDHRYATLKVMANSLLMGLQRLTAGKRAFIHFNRELLLGNLPLSFPKELLGVEILDVREPETRVAEVCKSLKKAGYLIVLDHVILDKKETRQIFVPLADIIKIDFHTTTAEERQGTLEKIDSSNILLLGEKIETPKAYKEALKLGCSYFQGFFFRKPDMISRREIPGQKLHYLQLLKKIHSSSLDVKGIEEIIKRDVSLTYKLFRFINSASYGFRVTISSIAHALLLLGEKELKKWLTIIVMSGIGSDKPQELMNTAVIRARFCELIASEFKPALQPWGYFLMGMFSLMDAFLDRPLEELLEELPLEEDIKAALLGRDPQARNVLEMVDAFEKARWEDIARSATECAIAEEKLAALYMDAVEWAKFLSAK
ncbi:MAG: HDOD domain-containing protein [bacterium]|nr:HDOD domain-containing protein [bacterium]